MKIISSKGIWIPMDIFESNDVCWTAKVIFLKIHSYSQNEMDCFVSNKTFAEFTGISETMVSRHISSLKKAGWIRENIDKSDGRKRYLESLVKTVVVSEFEAGLNKSSRQDQTKVQGRFEPEFESGLNNSLRQDWSKVYDNKEFNNQSNNTINNKKKAIVSIFKKAYLVSDFKISSSLVKQWNEVDWNGIQEEVLEDVLEFVRYRTEINKPIKTSKGMNQTLNEIRGRSVTEIKKQVDLVIKNEWTGLKFYDNNKKDKSNDWLNVIKNVKK